MIVPRGIRPEYSLYFLGAEILKVLKNQEQVEHDVFDLYESVRNHLQNYSFNQHLMALNWLYLLNVLTLTPENKLKLC